jgi:phosphate uptake regulator
MKIYRIKNELGKQLYIVSNNINDAIEIFEKTNNEDEKDINIKEIEFIDYCIIGD